MLTLTEKFSELPDIVFWDDTVKFLKEAFQGYKIKERLTTNKYFRVYSKTGGSYLEFAPATDEDHLPMYWECDCWRLEVSVDPDTGQIHTDTEWEWCMNNLPRKKREEPQERVTVRPLSEALAARRFAAIQRLRETQAKQEDPYKGDPDPWNR